MRTARSFNSGGYRFWVGFSNAMPHPHFQGMEPPGYPGRINMTVHPGHDNPLTATGLWLDGTFEITHVSGQQEPAVAVAPGGLNHPTALLPVPADALVRL